MATLGHIRSTDTLMVRVLAHSHNYMQLLSMEPLVQMHCFVLLTGEWESRFDKELTGKDRFYINSTTPVEVVMMLAPKYPLSMMVDNELGAQVG